MDAGAGWREAAVATATVDMIVRMPGGGAAGRADRVARQIERAIAVGVLEPGDRLPTESALADRFGVSPLTLRQSLAQLRATGRIATRRGRSGGSYVTARPADDPATAAAALARSSSEELRELGDYAATIAAGVGRRAAERAGAEELDRARADADSFAAAREPQDLRRLDTRFHVALAAAAHSGRLAAATLEVHGELAEFCWLGGRPGDRAAAAAAEHGVLLDAVARRDARAAEQAAAEHYEHQIRDVIAAYLEATAEGGGDGAH